MADKKYPSKYSNGKMVSAAQYITEIICEKKAKLDKKDLHYKFWISKEWEVYYKNQISSAHKLIKKYGDVPVIRALNNVRSSKIYSLRAPFLIPIIEEEKKKHDVENKDLTISLDRKDKATFSVNNSKKNILSKLKDIDNEC
jgi:hypothetical protein